MWFRKYRKYIGRGQRNIAAGLFMHRFCSQLLTIDQLGVVFLFALQKRASFMASSNNEEQVRLREDSTRTKNWKRWGPYLSERQWATVREDYSEDGSW